MNRVEQPLWGGESNKEFMEYKEYIEDFGKKEYLVDDLLENLSNIENIDQSKSFKEFLEENKGKKINGKTLFLEHSFFEEKEGNYKIINDIDEIIKIGNILDPEKVSRVNLNIKARKIIENSKEEIQEIEMKIRKIKQELLKIYKDEKVTKEEFLELQNLEKKLKLLKGKNEAQEEIITEIKNTLIKLKEKYNQEKTNREEEQKKSLDNYEIGEKVQNGEIISQEKVVSEKKEEKVKTSKEKKEEVEEYFVEINGKKILTDADLNPLENQETKNLEKSEQKINKAEAEKITENLEKATKQIETGNLTNPEASEEDVKQLKEYIEKSPLSDSALEKFLRAIEKFFGLLSGIKIDAYLDKDKGLILRDKLSEFDEKIFNEKYKQDFENILKNSEIKKAWVIKTEKSKLKGKDVEEDFALMVDVNGPNNMFVNKIDGENYSDKNAKIEIFYEAEGNFERKEIKVSELKNEMKNFNKKYSSILEFAQKINKQDGKVSIEDYKKVEKSGYKDYEKKEYLKGVESGLIADVKETKDGVKFLLLGEKDYVGKDEMLQKVKQINEKPKSFWRSYLNTLGIRLETKVRNPSMEKILVDLPGEKDLIYIDNGKEKRIYEARNGKAIDGNIIGISGIEVAGLYTDQIIILAHALKNNIDLRNIGEFKYDQIRNIFSKNKNLKDLKIFKPKGPEAIVALEKPFEEEKMRYKDFLVIKKREEKNSAQPSPQGEGVAPEKKSKEKEKTTGKTTTTNVHKEQANQVFGNNDEEDF